jgi:hypothetical protein
VIETLVVSNIVSSKKPRANSPARRSFAVRDQSIDSQSNSESELGCVCDSGRGHMPGNPEQCRLNAARCLKLAKRARRPEMRETFTALADTWTRLAAEHESDEALLRAISELEFGKPYEALPLALKLRSWPTSVTKGNVSRE